MHRVHTHGHDYVKGYWNSGGQSHNYFEGMKPAAGMGWPKLLQRMDLDGTGTISSVELVSAVRTVLSLGPDSVSDMEVHALFRSYVLMAYIVMACTAVATYVVMAYSTLVMSYVNIAQLLT